MLYLDAWNLKAYIVKSSINKNVQQGLEDVGDAFVAEAKITGVERTCTFALLQRCAAALAEGDPSAALHWVERRAHELHNSPLPFTLHRMQALKVCYMLSFKF